MRKILILALIVIGSINCSFAQEEVDSTIAVGMIYLKVNVGTLYPFNTSNPSVTKSNDYTTSYSFGLIGSSDDKSNVYWGFQFDGIQSSIVNTDKTIGIGGNYNIKGNLFKILVQYKFCRWFNLQYNIGIGGFECQRPWFIIPSSISYNGKQIEEYPIKQSNNCFVTGLGVNIKPLKWMSINANYDYLGAKFNFENIVHTEDKLVTRVYNSDFKLRGYLLTAGIIIHATY